MPALDARARHPGALLLIACGLIGCEAWSGPVVVAVESGALDAGQAPTDAGQDAGAPPRLDASVPDAARVPADLVVAAMSRPPASVAPGTGLTARVEIAARGAGPSAATTVRLDLVPEQVQTPTVRAGGAVVPRLGPGGRVELEVELWVPQGTLEQRYWLEATVDPEDVVPEADESNNRRRGGALWVSPLEISPSALDFGTVGIGCTSTQTVSLANRAQTSAFVWRVEVTPAPGPFEAWPPILIYELGSGARLPIEVTFTPTEVGLHRADLVIEHDQILGPVTVPLLAGAVQFPLRTESFTAWPGPRIDVLVVVDDSPTMQDEQGRVRAASGAFVEALRQRQVDFHLGVTTTDIAVTNAGGLRGLTPILTPETPLVDHEFAQNLSVGTGGSEVERGLEAARLALLSSVNPGFRRPEAALLLLFVSDEDDGSPAEVEDYRAAFEAAAGARGPAGVAVWAVTGDSARPCASTTAAGQKYRALASGPRDHRIDLCTFAWDADLGALIEPDFGGQRGFTLSRPPLDGTVRVIVDGVSQPEVGEEGRIWRLDGQVLRFEAGTAPRPGAAVRVEYRTQC